MLLAFVVSQVPRSPSIEIPSHASFVAGLLWQRE
jgi:hypothetical protein